MKPRYIMIEWDRIGHFPAIWTATTTENPEEAERWVGREIQYDPKFCQPQASTMSADREREVIVEMREEEEDTTLPEWEYIPNNSGGHWWLDVSDYEALLAAGWTKVEKHDNEGIYEGWGGTHMRYRAATREEAIASWEEVTGQDYFDPGCPCCGCPHYIGEPW